MPTVVQPNGFQELQKSDELYEEPLVIHQRTPKTGNDSLIILVHGFGGHRYGSKSSWGKFSRFLYSDISNADIGLYTYRTRFGRLKFWRSISVDDEAVVFAHELRELADYRKIILIGHSLGGLLCMAAISDLIESSNLPSHAAAASRIAGLFLMASPQLGSLRVPSFLSFLSPDLYALKPHGPLVTKIRNTFIEKVHMSEEGSPGQRVRIPMWAVVAASDYFVDRLSANVFLPRDRTLTARGLHGDIVRPRRVTDGSYGFVKKRIVLALELDLEAIDDKIDIGTRSNLPADTTVFVGRENDLAELKNLITSPDVRQVTLTGPGGIGKTRLALRIAAQFLENYKDGVWVVELSRIPDPTLVVLSIAQTLGLKEIPGHLMNETLSRYLRDKNMILILDTFEHVLDAAPIVEDLLKSSPYLKVLVTSRETLHTSSEHVFPVGSLTIPDLKQLPGLQIEDQSEAVTLYVNRAQAVNPGFNLNEDNAQEVAEICVVLEGIPLAIELAAARINVLTPQSMLPQLKDSKLMLLTGGPRDAPLRQQTLRATIDWSYDLLDVQQQRLFRRISVFVRGATQGAIEVVCDPEAPDLRLGSSIFFPSPEHPYSQSVNVLNLISSLVDKSLLTQQDNIGGESRYSMLDTLREYALEKVGELDEKEEAGESEALRMQHAQYYMNLATEAEPHLIMVEQQQWLDTLEMEHDNLRAALLWATESTGTARTDSKEDPQILTGLRTAGALWRFWDVGGHLSEGRGRIEELIAKAQKRMDIDSFGVVSKALATASHLAYRQGDYKGAQRLARECVELAKATMNKQIEAAALDKLGNAEYGLGQYRRAGVLYKESLNLFKELSARGDPLESKGSIAAVLGNLGNVAYMRKNYKIARRLHEKSLKMREELRGAAGIAASRNDLANVLYMLADYEGALRLYRSSLSFWRNIRHKPGVAATLAGIGSAQIQLGQVERGALLLGAADKLIEDIGGAFPPEDRQVGEDGKKNARKKLRGWYANTLEGGRLMSMEDATAYALLEH